MEVRVDFQDLAPGLFHLYCPITQFSNYSNYSVLLSKSDDAHPHEDVAEHTCTTTQREYSRAETIFRIFVDDDDHTNSKLYSTRLAELEH